jgi:dsRNA-specific ribonuclease
LTPELSWLEKTEGPDHQKIHHVTAKCENFSHSDSWVLSCAVRKEVIGYGRASDKSTAKHIAAHQALTYLKTLPEKHLFLSTP